MNYKKRKKVHHAQKVLEETGSDWHIQLQVGKSCTDSQWHRITCALWRAHRSLWACLRGKRGWLWSTLLRKIGWSCHRNNLIITSRSCLLKTRMRSPLCPGATNAESLRDFIWASSAVIWSILAESLTGPPFLETECVVSIADWLEYPNSAKQATCSARGILLQLTPRLLQMVNIQTGTTEIMSVLLVGEAQALQHWNSNITTSLYIPKAKWDKPIIIIIVRRKSVKYHNWWTEYINNSLVNKIIWGSTTPRAKQSGWAENANTGSEYRLHNWNQVEQKNPVLIQNTRLKSSWSRVIPTT